MVTVYLSGDKVLASALTPQLRRVLARIAGEPVMDKGAKEQKEEAKMPNIIEARITPEGKTILHVQGVQGARCQSLTDALVSRLGVVESSQATAEMYEQARVQENVGEQESS